MEQQVPEVNIIDEESASYNVEDYLSKPAISKHAEKITLEEEGGDVMDKLVKNPSDIGGWLWWITPIWKPFFLFWCAEHRPSIRYQK